VLLGMAQRNNVEAISILAETFGHPLYIGVKGSKKILEVLNKKLDLKVDMKSIEEEIKEIDTEFSKKKARLHDIAKQKSMGQVGETNYIG